MKRVLKYELQVTDVQTLTLPHGAQFLSAQNQGGRIQAWFEVTENKRPKVQRTFCVIGTGNPMPEQPLSFRATVQMGPLVWHVFEDELAIRQSNEIPGWSTTNTLEP